MCLVQKYVNNFILLKASSPPCSSGRPIRMRKSCSLSLRDCGGSQMQSGRRKLTVTRGQLIWGYSIWGYSIWGQLKWGYKVLYFLLPFQLIYFRLFGKMQLVKGGLDSNSKSLLLDVTTLPMVTATAKQICFLQICTTMYHSLVRVRPSLTGNFNGF